MGVKSRVLIIDDDVKTVEKLTEMLLLKQLSKSLKNISKENISYVMFNKN